MKESKNFNIYFDENQKTSGQRFFKQLSRELYKSDFYNDKNYKYLLLNINAPLSIFIKEKIKGKIIILRVDGVYFDKLSFEFCNTFRWPLKEFFKIFLKKNIFLKEVSFVANFLNQNYKQFVRIILADKLIFQSIFCKKVQQKFFSKKPYSVILNGSNFKKSNPKFKNESDNDLLKLVTIYDGVRPSKRIIEIIKFVNWLNLKKGINTKLFLLGYSGQLPKACFQKKNLIENSKFVKLFPKFINFNKKIVNIFTSSDIYITFTYRDACPNAVIEAMSYGLPVLGIGSGGVPDIVKDAGKLININDFKNGFFSAHRFENNFDEINFNELFNNLQDLIINKSQYRERVKKRFNDELDIKLIAKEYERSILGI